ncbi:hypothetical protein [Deinococcus wulumuqiensis]|uniref:Uncharacterized protein n=1 Tax=Deinococcus wulumuqiensis TaxID=980427 RepID=A0AAV4K8H9_9DEIO|nr:hypothetical protein [Deinococcus wulumuqiensis]QII20046.1 hypothetical protein G6R31_04170 [Deinococcus wulumuqiensis R12]GGI87220.1 hypothetical protein GCM10010914_22090 [Deinococcus wulumuqiensis]GGP29982.1 hypothetical protein GCM10008021_16330 [Deinococcus wulumuqiensis]
MTQPARTYDESLLTVIDPADREFSRTWVRTLLRDRPEVNRGGLPLGPGQPTRPSESTWPEYSRTDQELNAALELDAAFDPAANPPAKYYRPHFTAARLYLGDPALWKSRAVDGSSESRRDSQEIVSAWLAQGAALDSLIPVKPLPPFEAVAGTTEAGKVAPERPTTVVVRTGPGW